MNSRVRLGLALTLALGLLPASASAQAAAESAVVNAGAAAATAKTGKAFQSATDRLSRQLSERVQRQVQPPASGKKARAGTQAAAGAVPETAPEGTSSSQGLVIASIQGAQTACPSTGQAGAAPEGKPADGSAQADCGKEAPRKPAEKHPSVITLSFSK